MKKLSTMLLAALCLFVPVSGMAQGLPQFLTAMGEGLEEGLAAGAQQAMDAMDGDLTLSIETADTRIEEGQTMTLTIIAGNPRPVDTAVSFELALPGRLAMAEDAAWEAVLPAAAVDGETGEYVPSSTVFTREIALPSGGVSETVEISCEMGMGTRFYRAKTALDLCVSDVKVIAAAPGAQEGYLRTGDAFAYQIEVTNAGMAPKDVPLALVLPGGVELAGALPSGFAQQGNTISGQVRADAALVDEAGAAASRVAIEIPVKVSADALDGDDDALRLLTGTLRAGNERVALPRVQVAGPRISAKLIPQANSLEAGEQMELSILVVNAGLAQADVQLTCMLPEGLTLASDTAQQDKTAKKAEKAKESEKSEEPEKATAAEAGKLPTDGDDGAAQAAAVHNAEEDAPALTVKENNTLIYTLHMDAASEQEGGIAASTQTIRLKVQADEALDNVSEKLLGATLAFAADGGDVQLSEAVAMRVYKSSFLGIGEDEWVSIFWASLLLMVTVSCLYAAVHSADDHERDEYIFD